MESQSSYERRVSCYEALRHSKNPTEDHLPRPRASAAHQSDDDSSSQVYPGSSGNSSTCSSHSAGADVNVSDGSRSDRSGNRRVGTVHSRGVSSGMNVMNDSDDASYSGNGNGAMNVMNDSDDASYSGNGNGAMNIMNDSDDASYSGNGNDGSESGYSSSSHGSWECPPDVFVDVRTWETPKPHWLHYPRVRYSFVQAPLSDTKTLLGELQKNNDDEKRAELRKHVQKALPNLVDKQDFRDLASFLKVNEHQSSAISHLETLLLDLRNSQDMSVTDQLLEVARSSQTALMQLSDNNPNLLPMTCLHLMAVSALLSRCPHPSQDQWSALAVSKKQGKKSKGEGLKQTMVKAVQVFHEGLEGVLDNEASSFQEWRQAGFSEEERSKRKADFGRASFCELVVNVYTLLNELKRQGRHERGHGLLKTLQDLYDGSSARSGKHKLSEEIRAAMDFYLVRQMVTLLKSTFAEDELQVGEQFSEHSQLIANLTLTVIKGANPSLSDSLRREIAFLPFSVSRQIRETFNCFFRADGQPLHTLAQSYMATNLQSIGFHQDSLITCDQSADSAKSSETCAWRTFTCTVSQKEAEGAMYIPKASCLAGALVDKCLPRHPGCHENDAQRRQQIVQRAQRHTRNLNMLKKFSPKCRYLLQMYSYQLLPFPFYVTEEVQQRRLLSYVLDHRNSQLWLDTSVLVRVMMDVLEALTFLASRNIDPRDVTAYNMVVQAGAGNRRQSFGPRCSVLTCGDFVVKLADLGLSHEFHENDPMYNTVEIRPVRDQGAVPVRWTSPEALFEGLYSEKNMVYSVGCVMYELWTHGCQPFTSYDQTMDTDDILKMMLAQPGSIQLADRPCIPDAVNKLIRQCTHRDPRERPQLLQVKEKLSQLCPGERHDVRELGLESALSLKTEYPQLSQSQVDRRHIPETGIPKSIQVLIDSGKNSDLYSKARQSMCILSDKTEATEEELHTADWIHIQIEEDRTVVEEVVSPKFVRDELPSLEVSDLEGATCWSRADDGLPRLRQQDELLVHKREYPRSVTLKTAALVGYLWDNGDHCYEPPTDLSCLVPFLSLARVVQNLHEKGWIIRDLKEDSILIDCNSGQAMLPRIGRMRRLASTQSYLVDDVFEDSRRWLSPEVLVSGQYGKENDIFMLGTVMGQAFRISELAALNPEATDRDFAPCSNIEKRKVIDYVRDHGREEHAPSHCPEWLHQLITECRHPERGQRPSAQDVVNTLQQHCLLQGSPHRPFIEDPNVGRDVQAATNEEAAPAVEMRRKTKATKQTSSPPPQLKLFRSVKARLQRPRSKRPTNNPEKRVTIANTSAATASLSSLEETELKVVEISHTAARLASRQSLPRPRAWAAGGTEILSGDVGQRAGSPSTMRREYQNLSPTNQVEAVSYELPPGATTENNPVLFPSELTGKKRNPAPDIRQRCLSTSEHGASAADRVGTRRRQRRRRRDDPIGVRRTAHRPAGARQPGDGHQFHGYDRLRPDPEQTEAKSIFRSGPLRGRSGGKRRTGVTVTAGAKTVSFGGRHQEVIAETDTRVAASGSEATVNRRALSRGANNHPAEDGCTSLGVTGAKTHREDGFVTSVGVTRAKTHSEDGFVTSVGVTGAKTHVEDGFVTSLGATGVETYRDDGYLTPSREDAFVTSLGVTRTKTHREDGFMTSLGATGVETYRDDGYPTPSREDAFVTSQGVTRTKTHTEGGFMTSRTRTKTQDGFVTSLRVTHTKTHKEDGFMTSLGVTRAETYTNNGDLTPSRATDSEPATHSRRFPTLNLSRTPTHQPQAAPGTYRKSKQDVPSVPDRPNWLLWQNRYVPSQVFKGPTLSPAQLAYSFREHSDELAASRNCCRRRVELKSERAANLRLTHTGTRKQAPRTEVEHNVFQENDTDVYEEIDDVEMGDVDNYDEPEPCSSAPVDSSVEVAPRQTSGNTASIRQAAIANDDEHSSTKEDASYAERFEWRIIPDDATHEFCESLPSDSACYCVARSAFPTVSTDPCPAHSQFEDSALLSGRAVGACGDENLYEISEEEEDNADECSWRGYDYIGEDDNAVTARNRVWNSHAFLVDSLNPGLNRVIPVNLVQGRRPESQCSHGDSLDSELKARGAFRMGQSSEDPEYLELH